MISLLILSCWSGDTELYKGKSLAHLGVGGLFGMAPIDNTFFSLIGMKWEEKYVLYHNFSAHKIATECHILRAGVKII